MSSFKLEYERKDLPKGFIKYGLPLLIIGIISLVYGFFMGDAEMAHRASFNSLIALMFVVSVGLGAIFMVALEYIAGAVWSVPFRRLAEYQGFIFLLVPLLAIPVLFNMHDLFHWTHAEAVANDDLLSAKSPYLNEPGFFFRSGLIFVVMSLFYLLFTRNSRKQDEDGSQKKTKINIVFSAIFMPLFAISVTVLGIDYLMSLEPHWFSTIFGVYYFAGTFLAALGVLTIIAVTLNENGYMPKGINKNHYYSLGGLMFAFTAFWGYIAFSQYMLIWYANVPEETFWFIARQEGLWGAVSIGLIFIHFVVPFGLLINRSSKMNPKRLKLTAYWILFAHIYDLYWLIMPQYNENVPVFGWMEVGSVALAAGFIMTVFYLIANKKNLVAVKDPKLERAMNFHL